MARTHENRTYPQKSKLEAPTLADHALPDVSGCPIARAEEALRAIEGRWKLLILSFLFLRPIMRFSELERAIPGVSQRMLVQQLRDLEEHGIVKRTVYPQVPPKVEYALTEIGRALCPALQALLDWAEYRAKVLAEPSST